MIADTDTEWAYVFNSSEDQDFMEVWYHAFWDNKNPWRLLYFVLLSRGKDVEIDWQAMSTAADTLYGKEVVCKPQ